MSRRSRPIRAAWAVISLELLALACGGGGGAPSNPTIDPPVVTLVTPAAQAVLRGNAVTIQVRATADTPISAFSFTAPAGLAGTVTWDDDTHTAATLAGSLDTTKLEDGAVTVTASAKNLGGETAKSFAFTVNNTAVPAVIDGNFASFLDEAGLTVGTQAGSAPAMAAVPAVYVPASTTRIAVPVNGTIHKVVTRLGWTGTVTAAELEGANAQNVPAVRVLVPVAGAGVTLSSAAATVGVTCTGCSSSSAAVDLLPFVSGSAPSGFAAVLVPLSSNTIPALGSLPAGTASVSLSVSVETHDSSGQVAVGGPWAFTIGVLGPPVVLSEDTAYPSLADGRNASYYRVGSNSANGYAGLWSLANFSAETGARLLHYVVTNPAPVPVALEITSLPAVQTLRETYGGKANVTSVTPTPPSVVTTTTATANGSPYGCYPPSASGPTCSGGTPIYYVIGSSASCIASASTPTPSPTSVDYTVGSGITTWFRAYVSDSTPAQLTGTGHLVLPAASGTAPARVDIYVLRTILAAGDRPGLGLLTFNWSGAASAFVEKTAFTTYTMGTCVLVQGQTCGMGAWQWNSCPWTGTNWGRVLTRATEELTGSFAARTTGIQTGEVGAPTTVGNASLAGRAIQH